MKVYSAPLRCGYLLGALLLLGTLGGSAAGEINMVRTNMVDRWITNVIEVRVPLNLFINEYRTNWVEQRRTNQVDVFATNNVTVEALRTNFVKGYHTNWANVTLTNDVRVDALHTNFLTAYQTNWNYMNVTNEVAVNLYETNFISEFQTNSKTMFVTNWETVLVMRTNWIFAPVTNVVQLDLITNRPVAAHQPATPQRASLELSGSKDTFAVSTATLSSDLLIEGKTTGRTTATQVEVQLQASWSADPRILLQAPHWRVEKEDATILSFGQEAVFRRLLPAGRYKVELRAQKDVNGPVMAARAILVLSPREAIVQPTLAARQ
jgi:hypothetical protein